MQDINNPFISRFNKNLSNRAGQVLNNFYLMPEKAS